MDSREVSPRATTYLTETLAMAPPTGTRVQNAYANQAEARRPASAVPKKVVRGPIVDKPFTISSLGFVRSSPRGHCGVTLGATKCCGMLHKSKKSARQPEAARWPRIRPKNSDQLADSKHQIGFVCSVLFATESRPRCTNLHNPAQKRPNYPKLPFEPKPTLRVTVSPLRRVTASPRRPSAPPTPPSPPPTPHRSR